MHETLHFPGKAGRLKGDMVHYAYPSLEAYIAHMDRYSALGAEQVVREGGRRLNPWMFGVSVVLNPIATFLYNYFFRLGFLDGREGLLLHLYHSVDVSGSMPRLGNRGAADSRAPVLRICPFHKLRGRLSVPATQA